MSLPNRIAFSIGSIHIYWYGVLIACAVILSVLYSAYYLKKKNYPEDAIYNLALWCIPFAVVFARLYYVLFTFSYYKDNLWSVFYIWEGGLAIFGAVIGGALGAYLCCKRHKYSFAEVADIIAPALVFSQAIGRWGNFFNQEAYGQAVLNPSLQFFPYAVYIENPSLYSATHWFQATFFYESMACLLIALILHFIVRVKAKEKGTVFLAYLFLYGLERAFIEGLRTDSLYLGNLRVSQVLSILLVVSSGVLFFLKWYNRRQEAQVEADPALALGVKAEDVDLGKDKAEESAKTENEEAQTTETNDTEQANDTEIPSIDTDAKEKAEDSAPSDQ